MRLSTPARVWARRGLIAIGAVALTMPLAAVGANAATSGGKWAVAGSAPSWATSNRASGVPDASTRVNFNVVLPLRNAAAAAKLAASVTNPNAAAYGSYLTAGQFNAAYAPTADSVSKVEAYLKDQGITVTGVAAGNRWVSANATIAQINTAFSTTVRNYKYQGKTLRAPSSSLYVGNGMKGLISGIVGVSQDGALRTPTGVTPASTSPSDVPAPSACSTYWDQHEQVTPRAYGKTSFPTPNCGYTASQLRTAYGLNGAEHSGDTGRGVTVAIVDAYASPTIEADANQLSRMEGEPQFKHNQYTETVMGPFTLQDECGGELGWNEEESLDVEAVHAMAPGANIHYVGAANCDTGIDDAVNFIIQHHTATIVSNSYGFLGEGGLGDEVSLEDSMFLQAALEGIGFYFSTGDNGDLTTIGDPIPEASFPSTDPWVTAVGGTSLAINRNGSYKFETTWGNDLDVIDQTTSPSTFTEPLPGEFLSGGGGGTSRLFTQPFYQVGTVPSSLSRQYSRTPARVVPDVATEGDPETGFLIGISDGGPFQTVQIGGTSLSTPLFAGIQAVAQQKRFFPIGFANPLLYLGGHGNSAFRDVKDPATPLALITISGKSFLTMASDTSLHATRGYDDATGLGSPNGNAFLHLEQRFF